MADNKENNKAAANSQKEIDRIAAVRELIFGENMKEYNSEFADVYDKIQSLKESSDKNLKEAVSNLENK